MPEIFVRLLLWHLHILTQHFRVHVSFYRQHFYKQRQAETGKKSSKMLSDIQWLNLYYLKIAHTLYPRYYPKIIGDILKNKQKNKSVYIHTINHNENEDEREK